MIALGDTILAIISFLSYPTWHLVVLYVILLLLVVQSLMKSWGL